MMSSGELKSIRGGQAYAVDKNIYVGTPVYDNKVALLRDVGNITREIISVNGVEPLTLQQANETYQTFKGTSPLTFIVPMAVNGISYDAKANKIVWTQTDNKESPTTTHEIALPVVTEINDTTMATAATNIPSVAAVKAYVDDLKLDYTESSDTLALSTSTTSLCSISIAQKHIYVGDTTYKNTELSIIPTTEAATTLSIANSSSSTITDDSVYDNYVPTIGYLVKNNLSGNVHSSIEADTLVSQDDPGTEFVFLENA